MNAKALLCDYAEVAQGKLFITGANINLLGMQPSDPPYPVNIALAISITVPWNATNQQHTMTIELIAEGGAGGNERVQLNPDPNLPSEHQGKIVAQFSAGRAPNMKPGTDTLIPIAIPLMGFPLPYPGSYFFEVQIDGTEVDRVSFTADIINPGMGIGMGMGPF